MKYVPTWLPGAGFKRQALKWRRSVRAMLDLPFRMVQERMVSLVVSEGVKKKSLFYRRQKVPLHPVLLPRSWNGWVETK